MEFAIAAPILLSLNLFVIDGARIFLIWRQVHNAALGIVAGAAKLSLTTDPTTGAVTSLLTYDQMQQAMSTVFADIPGLNLGNGGGLLPGSFAVTLSSIWYYPLCTQATITTCSPTQVPFVRWSTYLNPSYVGAGPNLMSGVVRPCTGFALTAVASFPDDNTQYNVMIDPKLAAGGNPEITAPPQLVADVQYSFTPYYPIFFKSYVFYASAASPAPIGGLDQTTEINTNAAMGNVANCAY
jgi:Flp pilus assembly protein TadG